MAQSKVKKGIFWRTLEGIGVQGMQFVIQMVLARLLMPEDFGIIAILSIFVNLATTFVYNGLGAAVLQRKHPDDVDFSTVFWVENGIAWLMYAIIFVSAPFIGDFYDNPAISTYLRGFALTVIISVVGSIETTVLRSRMDFKSSFIANFTGIVCQGAVGIGCALMGFGVWSLIFSQIAYRIVIVVLLWYFARYLPKLIFSWQRLKELFGFSWKLFVGWIIGTVYQDLFSLIIGKVYNERILGFYAKGNSIPYVMNRVITQVTGSVMFPALAKNQDDLKVVKSQTRQMLSLSVALVFPMMAVLAGVANPVVRLLLTDKWLPAVPIIQIFCIPAAISVISNANMQTFNALGRSDVFLRLEMIKRSITILLVLILSRIDFYLMLCSIAMMGVVDLSINTYFNKRLVNYPAREYWADLLPGALVSLLMFGCVVSFNYSIDHLVVRLAMQLLVAAAIYAYLLFGGKMESFTKLKDILLSYAKRK